MYHGQGVSRMLKLSIASRKGHCHLMFLQVLGSRRSLYECIGGGSMCTLVATSGICGNGALLNASPGQGHSEASAKQ